MAYARGYLFNSIVGKARTKVVGHYGLTGSNEDVKAKVDWLLTKSKFLYGDIDYQVFSLYFSHIDLTFH